MLVMDRHENVVDAVVLATPKKPPKVAADLALMLCARSITLFAYFVCTIGRWIRRQTANRLRESRRMPIWS